MPGEVRIEHLVTSDDDVLNNVWLIGDDDEVLVVDAAHDPDAIERAVGDRTAVAIACTAGLDAHVRYAPELAERLTTQVLLHPDDRALWDVVHARHEPDGPLREGQVLHVAGLRVRVLHTPGQTPGSVCLEVPDLGVVFTGDTRRSHPRLADLPPETRLLRGHGDETTVAAVAERTG
ncbi:MAG: MBL fold metallo-hydrolase [Frankiales bacterium]|nr:MAG: MBL fold metallo-hydrolase [Frankiales bacterium]